MGRKKKHIFFALIILFIILFALISYYFFFYRTNTSIKSTDQGSHGVVIQNPMKDIVERNIDKSGNANQDAIISQGVKDFNESYIAYLLAAIGVSKLHKYSMGYGDPKLEFVIDDETWNAQISGGLMIGKGKSDKPDIRITMKKQDAVMALLSPDIKAYMKTSVSSGNTQIETIAGKLELLSKGYLDLYKEITGEMPKL